MIAFFPLAFEFIIQNPVTQHFITCGVTGSFLNKPRVVIFSCSDRIVFWGSGRKTCPQLIECEGHIV
jgi:hypothetical protein